MVAAAGAATTVFGVCGAGGACVWGEGCCCWALLLAAAAAAPLRLGHESREVPPRRPPGGGAWFADLGFRDRRGGAFHELLMVLFTNFCWGWGCCVRGYRGFAWWMLLVDGRLRFDAGVSWLRYHTGRRRIHGAHTQPLIQGFTPHTRGAYTPHTARIQGCLAYTHHIHTAYGRAYTRSDRHADRWRGSDRTSNRSTQRTENPARSAEGPEPLAADGAQLQVVSCEQDAVAVSHGRPPSPLGRCEGKGHRWSDAGE